MIKSILITESRWLSRIEELLKGKSVTLDSASQTHWFNLVCKLHLKSDRILMESSGKRLDHL